MNHHLLKIAVLLLLATCLICPTDYPRLNQFPEWFTVAKDATYETDHGSLSGATLRGWLTLSVTPEKPYQLRLSKP